MDQFQTSSQFHFKYAIAHRDARVKGPRPATTFAIFIFLSEWDGRVADRAEDAPPALRALLDRLNEMDAGSWNDYECIRLRIEEFDPGTEVYDPETRVSFMARPLDARRHWGGFPSDASLAKEAPNIAKVLAEVNPPRKLLPAEQAEHDRKAAKAEQQAAEDAERAAEQEHRAHLDREAVAEAVGDVVDALQNTHWPAERRAAAILNGAALFALRPELVPLLAAYDEVAEIAA